MLQKAVKTVPNHVFELFRPSVHRNVPARVYNGLKKCAYMKAGA